MCVLIIHNAMDFTFFNSVVDIEAEDPTSCSGKPDNMSTDEMFLTH
jgi:hypothetical protein